MRLGRSDWPLLRWNMLAMCASILIGATIVYSSGKLAESARQEKHNAQTSLDQARNRLATANRDSEDRALYASQYQALIEQGIIGDEPRLDWVEGLENLRRQNLVTGFRYHIAPQQSHASQKTMAAGNFDIRYSEMMLQFDLLHEQQLLDFFSALRGQIKGWYQLDSCTLQRNTAMAELPGNNLPQLKAECSGGWVTLKKRGAP